MKGNGTLDAAIDYSDFIRGSEKRRAHDDFLLTIEKLGVLVIDGDETTDYIIYDGRVD